MDNQSHLDGSIKLMKFINNQALFDMEPQQVNFTWLNRRVGQDLIQVRLDHALITRCWLKNIGCSLSSLSKIGSDHFPICFNADSIIAKGHLPFRFEKMWVDHLELDQYIKDWWNVNIQGTAMFIVVKKLLSVE